MLGKTISHYEILEKLGEGGMGVVYKALDKKLDRHVAVKFLPSTVAEDGATKARFIQEAKVVAALNHPNILAIHDIDEVDGNLFYVMELVDGRTLKAHISDMKSGSIIGVMQAFDWTAQIAGALKSAHGQHIVHRDIKPENVMMAKDGALKIMDFGIAQLRNSSGLTKTGASLGTLSYMSPEQAQGIATDHRSDIWSLGVVLYELLTGERPFRAEHDAGLLYMIVNENPPFPSEMDKKLPRHVDALVMKMLEKDRANRYESMDELLQSLQETRHAIEATGTQLKAKTIAVLPFGNISPDKESDYFSDGLTEELIVSLSKLTEIRVIPRSTAMQYKGSKKGVPAIGKELGVRHVLTGNVRKFQDNLRISVEVIDVETGEQLWAETYKGRLEDIFDIQEQVSKQIVEALMLKLSPREKAMLSKRATENPEAFDYYMRARNAMDRRTKMDYNAAIQLFQRAIELDRRYASAYAGLGEAYASLYLDFDRNETYLDLAMDAANKALIYDATLSEAYAALAIAYFNKKEPDEALEAGRKAIELDPNNAVAYWILGRIYHSSDRDDRAIELYRKCIELNPDFYSAHCDLYTSYKKLGDVQNENNKLNDILEILPRHLSHHPDDARAHMLFSISLVYAGRTDDAKQEAAKALSLNPNDPLMLYNGACFYASLGETRLALSTLKNSIRAGHSNYEWIKRDPDFDSIRDEPEYIELMRGK